MFAVSPTGCVSGVVPAAVPVKARPLTVTPMPVPALVLTKFAAYPFVDNRTFAVSPASTPFNTTLFELIVAAVVRHTACCSP